MRTRLLTAAILLTVPAAIAVLPRGAFLVLAIAAGLAVTREALALLEARGHRPLKAPAFAGVVLLNASFFRPETLALSTVMALCAVLAVAGFLVSARPVNEALDAIPATLAVLVLPALLLAFEVGIRNLGDRGAVAEGGARFDGPALLLFLYAVVFGNDAAAYFVGRAIGRVKLIPHVSPNKTVEGFLAGLLAGVALGLVVHALLPSGLSRPQAVLFGVLLAAAAVLGDLTVSLLKRSAGVKDSGNLLPGHGGVLDRLDGLLFASPLLLALVTASATAAGSGP